MKKKLNLVGNCFKKLLVQYIGNGGGGYYIKLYYCLVCRFDNREDVRLDLYK